MSKKSFTKLKKVILHGKIIVDIHILFRNFTRFRVTINTVLYCVFEYNLLTQNSILIGSRSENRLI